MKMVVVTDDGTTSSQHFGRAMFYVVSTVEGGKVLSKRVHQAVCQDVRR